MTTMATSVGSHASQQKSQKSIICGLLKEVRKGSEVFFCLLVCFHRVHATWNEFTVAPLRRPKMKWTTNPSHNAT